MCNCIVFLFQAEDGIRDLVRSRGLGDVYKRQVQLLAQLAVERQDLKLAGGLQAQIRARGEQVALACLLYTSDAADERSSVDLGGRRILKKKNKARGFWCS